MASGQTARKSGGRPSERDEPKRAAIALRTTPGIKERLQRAADDRGRSVTQEVEARIETSFELDDIFGSIENKALFIELARQIAKAETVTGKRWQDDTATHRAALKLIDSALKSNRPRPKNYDEVTNLLKKHDELSESLANNTTILREIGAINRNALIAYSNAIDGWLKTAEEAWHWPNEPGRELTEDDRATVRKMIAKWEKLRALTQETKEAADEAIGPHWEAIKRGDELADDILSGAD